MSPLLHCLDSKMMCSRLQMYSAPLSILRECLLSLCFTVFVSLPPLPPRSSSLVALWCQIQLCMYPVSLIAPFLRSCVVYIVQPPAAKPGGSPHLRRSLSLSFTQRHIHSSYSDPSSPSSCCFSDHSWSSLHHLKPLKFVLISFHCPHVSLRIASFVRSLVSPHSLFIFHPL